MGKNKNNEATVENIGSKVGKTILKVKKVKGGVGIRVKGTSMEMISIIAGLTQSLSLEHSLNPIEVVEAALEMLGMKVVIMENDSSIIETVEEHF